MYNNPRTCERCCQRCQQYLIVDHWSIYACDIYHVNYNECVKCNYNYKKNK